MHLRAARSRHRAQLNWAAIGYPGPQARSAIRSSGRSRSASPETATRARRSRRTSSSSAPARAAASSRPSSPQPARRSCVLEMGGYHDEPTSTGSSSGPTRTSILNGGPFPTAEGQVSIQAGTVVGGGTVVNWTNCLRTHRMRPRRSGRPSTASRASTAPTTTLTSTRSGSGSRSTTNAATSTARTSACRRAARSSARLPDDHPEHRSRDLRPGHRRLHGLRRPVGLEALDARRRTWPTPQAATPSFVIHCRGRAHPRRGRPRGRGRGELRRPRGAADGDARRPSTRAPTVVVACGSIESPALLLRSGIGGPAVGDYLRLHPTSAVAGFYEEEQDCMVGPAAGGALARVRGSPVTATAS